MSYQLSQHASNKEVLKYLNLPFDTIITTLDRTYYPKENEYIVHIYKKNSKLFEVNVHCNHRRHNKFGPAYLRFNFDALYFINYYDKDYPHRVGAPARIMLKKNGMISCEEYLIKGVLHNRVGPAIRIFKNGCWDNYFYINGCKVSLDNFHRRVQ